MGAAGGWSHGVAFGENPYVLLCFCRKCWKLFDKSSNGDYPPTLAARVLEGSDSLGREIPTHEALGIPTSRVLWSIWILLQTKFAGLS